MRRPLEVICRAVGIGALLLALALLWRTSATAATPAVSLTTAALHDSSATLLASELSALIQRSARDSTWTAMQFTLDRVPSSAARDVLAAARMAGMPIAWADSTRARGLVVSASADVDPQAGVWVRASGQSGQALVLRDAASVLDSVADASRGLTIRGAQLSTAVTAEQGASRARVRVPAVATLRRILLFARPGWEAKFVTAALEERGWQVDGTLSIGRRASVTIGAPLALDTARYAAAVVLDSGVATSAQLTRFVAQGGGVVLAGDALLGAGASTLRPASVTGSRPAVAGALLTNAPRNGLDALELRAAPTAVVLQTELHGATAEPAVVAWRVGAGRVLASGYRETWRWRMEGSTDGMDAHRAWWSGLVRAVAFAPTPVASAQSANVLSQPTGSAEHAPRTALWPGDAAPYADLVARLGEPVILRSRAEGAPVSPTRPGALQWLLYAVAASALLAEWCLRRVRGAP